MSNTKKISIILIAGILNVLYFYACGFWTSLKTEGIRGLLYGIWGLVVIVILAMGATCIGLQLYYRIKYRRFRRYDCDRMIWIQCLLLLFYYVSAFLFAYVYSLESAMLYLVMVPTAIIVFLIRAGKAIWKSDEEIYFLHENGSLYRVTELHEETDKIEFTYETGEGEKRCSLPRKGRSTAYRK